ncbi:Uncharacterised protein [uncultured archaeon]|nr:Uncharacterised protein [uncultured archaeon]
MAKQKIVEKKNAAPQDGSQQGGKLIITAAIVREKPLDEKAILGKDGKQQPPQNGKEQLTYASMVVPVQPATNSAFFPYFKTGMC